MYVAFQEALVKSIDDTSDAKTAAEVLAKKLFTQEELQKSSVTGFQCNKDYEARPGLSPSRRNLLESKQQTKIIIFISCMYENMYS